MADESIHDATTGVERSPTSWRTGSDAADQVGHRG
jgi:hypothetical protein